MRGRKPAGICAGSSPVEKVPAAPAWLSKAGKAEWNRVCPILVNERRTLTVADLPTLESYCAAVGQVQEASRILEKEGLTFTGPTGPKKHPAASLRHDAMTQVRQLGSELGLTPVSRSRPAMRDDNGSEDTSDLAL